MASIDALMSVALRFLGVRNGPRFTAEHAISFDELKHLSEDAWREVLSEGPKTAARWIEAAAIYGDVDAQLHWAQMLLDGHGTARDPERAFRWFGVAAKSGRADAINLLGRCHERGWGVPVDFGKAAACYRQAADEDFDWALFNLACLLFEGKGVARDLDGAFDLFKQAAGHGHVKSCYRIGLYYEHGWRRTLDLSVAAEWYRRGAEGGDVRGQYRYGLVLLACGRFEEARSWLRLVADRGPAEFCRTTASELLAWATDGPGKSIAAAHSPLDNRTKSTASGGPGRG